MPFRQVHAAHKVRRQRRPESGVSKPAKIDSAEAYAFLSVVAPKLEQFRRRMVVANNHLKGDDPEMARINAIVESQLAVKEFMSALADLSQLVEPIDIVLEAVREEPPAPIEETPAPETPAPEPEPEPAPVQAAAPPAETTAAPAKPKRDQLPPADAWLQIGTSIAFDRLTAAGMSPSSAEFHLEDVYATVGLKHPDGGPISEATIREWRTKFGARHGSWRNAAIKRRASPSKSGNALTDAKARVSDMATTFMKMTQLGASKQR
jgi:hypothetical protein